MGKESEKPGRGVCHIPLAAFKTTFKIIFYTVLLLSVALLAIIVRGFVVTREITPNHLANDANPLVDLSTVKTITRSITRGPDGTITFHALFGDAILDSAPGNGASKSETIMFLHGFPDNWHSFKHQMDYFRRKGYNVLVPAGRGFAPDSLSRTGDYSLPTLARDVIDWLDFLKLDRVHLVGHDWGSVYGAFESGEKKTTVMGFCAWHDFFFFFLSSCSIGQAAVTMAPERFLSWTGMSVYNSKYFTAGAMMVPKQLFNSWYMLFFQLPVLPEQWVVHAGGLEKLFKDWAYTGYSQQRLESIKETLSQPGVASGAIGYYRSNVLQVLSLGVMTPKIYDSISRPILVPSLIMTGSKCGCIDSRIYPQVTSLNDYTKGVRLEFVEDAGHFPHHEQPAVVNKLLEAHFAANKATGSK